MEDDVKINGVTYSGVDEISLPKSDGTGFVKFSKSSGTTSGGGRMYKHVFTVYLGNNPNFDYEKPLDSTQRKTLNEFLVISIDSPKKDAVKTYEDFTNLVENNDYMGMEAPYAFETRGEYDCVLPCGDTLLWSTASVLNKNSVPINPLNGGEHLIADDVNLLKLRIDTFNFNDQKLAEYEHEEHASKNEFPEVGVPHVIYYAQDTQNMYFWHEKLHKYIWAYNYKEYVVNDDFIILSFKELNTPTDMSFVNAVSYHNYAFEGKNLEEIKDILKMIYISGGNPPEIQDESEIENILKRFIFIHDYFLGYHVTITKENFDNCIKEIYII